MFARVTSLVHPPNTGLFSVLSDPILSSLILICLILCQYVLHILISHTTHYRVLQNPCNTVLNLRSQ